MPSLNIKIMAYQLGAHIHIGNFVRAYQGIIYSGNATEVFIHKGANAFIYIQSNGEIAFSDCSAMDEFIEFVNRFVSDPVLSWREYKEDFLIEINPDEPVQFKYNTISVPEINPDLIKIVLLNVSQSCVLDYFTALSQSILSETSLLALELHQNGKLRSSKTGLMKLIGKALFTQSRIIDNLYFLDAPDTVWEDEYLSEVNTGLNKIFKVKPRFREIEYTLKHIDENLRTFSQLLHHRESNKLEWIIILLILFELLHALVGKYI